MSSLNGDSKNDDPAPPSPAKSPVASRHKNRPPSIGDASQLFGGGGGGLDDFFGPSAYSSHPSQQSPSVFGPLAEEAEPAPTSNSDPNDPFAWPSLDQSNPSNQSQFGTHPVERLDNQPAFDHYSPAIPPTGYDNSYNPIPNPNIPLNHSHSHSAPNHQIYPPADHYSDPSYAAQDQNQAYSAYSQQFYGQPADNNATGLGISNAAHQAPYHPHTQSAYDNYNPYVPQNPYSTPNLPHLAADPITRSASVNSIQSTPILQDVPSLQRPGLSQALTSQPGATALSLNRPKVYDAYDPPAIRKKKPFAVGATASLPSSPALGGQGATPQFAATSFGQVLQPHVLPPPPKQRSTSTPANAPPLSEFTRHDHNDFYAPTSQAYGSQLPFVPPTYSDLQSSSPVGNGLTCFMDSPRPTNLALDTTAHPSSTSNATSYQPGDPNANFGSAQPAYAGLKSPSLSCGPHTSQLDDPYAPTDFNPAHSHSVNNQTGFKLSQDSQSIGTLQQPESGYPYGRATSPLAKTAESHSSPPIGPYQPDRAPTPPSPAYAYGPASPSNSNSLAVAHDRRPKKSSPLKMAVSANDPSAQADAGHSTIVPTDSVIQTVDESQQPAEALLPDSIDQLDLAARRLSLNATPTSPSAYDLPKSETSVESQPSQRGTDNAQSPPLAPSASDPFPPALNSHIAPKTLSVPDVHVQPATPDISLTDARDLTAASNFDVLADLGPGHVAQSTSQPVTGAAVPNIDYGYGVEGFSASEDSGYAYGAEFSYGPSQAAAPELTQPGYSQLPATSEPSDKSLSQPYNPYNAPLNPDSSYADLNPNAYLNTGTGQYASQQPSGFAAPNPYDPYAQSSPYSPTDNVHNTQSTYGPISDGSQALLGIQPEGSQSDVPMDSSYLTGLNPRDASLTEPHQSTIYNAYDPTHHPAAERSSAQAHDPMLERLKARVAVASFGFGGKLITVLPGSSFASPDQLGFEDPYQSGGVMPANVDSRATVTVQQLSDVIPSAELQAFPGPLFMDGGNRSSVGKKRKEVVGWLEAKLSEAEKELVFVQNAGAAHQPLSQTQGEEGKVEELQDKIVLLKLLRVLVDNEGKLSGTPKVEEAVRSMLHSFGSRPALDNVSALVLNPSEPHLDDSDPKDVIAAYTVRSACLDNIQGFLVNGERPQALRHAVEQKMWTHALVIANSLGPDVWRETVREFSRFELNGHREAAGGEERSSASNGREGLRMLYNLFAGAGPAAVDEFFPSPSVLIGAPPAHHPEPYGLPVIPIIPPNGLSGTSRVSSPVPMPSIVQAVHSKIPKDVLQQWRTTVALTIANRVPGSVPFLLKLGDTLVKNGRVYAGHVTYLLSNGVTPLASLENGARIGLLGCPSPTATDRPGLDVEAVMLTEVLEFGLSLAPVAKSQEPFIGIPHLQAYRLALGVEYATLGLVNSANKYCEALAATLKLASKPCAFYHSTLVEQLKAFSGRLSATPVQEKGSSWITRKMARPTLDNVWQTLEGRVHKFVAGEDDGGESAGTGLGGPAVPNNKALGPFSHYSSISPGSTSGTVSRVQSSSDLRYANLGGPGPFQYGASLQRPASGADYSTSVYERDTRQRSSSAMVPKYGSGSPSPTYQSTFGDHAASGQSLLHGSSVTDPTSPSASTGAAETGAGWSGGGWWEAASSHGTPANGSQPTFAAVEDAGIADDGDGFIDPMASFGVMPSFGSGAGVEGRAGGEPGGLRACTEEDEEDLGFGNSHSRRREQTNEANNGVGESATGTEPSGGASAEKDSKGTKHAASGSWLGRWFKREAPAQPAGSGPVKANLGEEVSLVYDPDTKRWVNKKAGQSPAPSGGPPPPPARAQTASPTSAMGRGAPPPTGRSATAGLPNGRSSLESPAPGPAPTMLRTASSAAQFGGSSGGALPPPPLSSASSLSVASSNGTTGGKKPAAKKNLRSRYVEIR